MKKLILALMILVLLIPYGYARENVGSQPQSFNKPNVQDYKLIDVNQISAWVTNYGSIFRHPTTGNSGFEFPAGGGVFAIYASGLWVGARVNGQPRVAVAEYSYEYGPGKIINGEPADAGDSRYQVYKLVRGQSFPDAAIEDGAPFLDVNANDVYDPGTDETRILGDQFLWSVYNDADPATHVNMATAPLGVEIQQSVFGFARTGPLGNTVFVKWLVVNKSGTELQDTYITVWSDPDLGDSGDDFVGCDTTLSLGYVYNSNDNDGEYGAAPPAAGYDFFQGPIVSSPGDTAFVSGDTILDYRNLPMTSFVYYNNSNENNGNPQTGAEAYNFMQARWRDGSPITFGGTGIDPGNPPTSFMYPGDPEAGTGWLDSSPADRRFMMTTGPFTMEPFEDSNGNGRADVGEPGVQEIVVGVIVARGSNNLNSVTLLKQFDELAQLAYDLNFNLADPPPPPVVDVSKLNQQIILDWGNTDPDKGATYEEVEAYDARDPIVKPTPQNPDPDTTYTFEGYLVYQYDFLDTRNSRLVANYDLADGLTEVRDLVLDTGTGEYLEKLVWKGTDSGLKRFQIINQDQFSSSGNPTLVNGKRYWFSVVAWGYNEDSSPKTIYSPLMEGVNFWEITPEAPAISSSYSEKIQGNIISSSKEGQSDGSAFGIVVDPTKVTADNYIAEFETDTDGNIYWNLTDQTSGEVVLNEIYHQSSDSTDISYPVADGIQWKILGPVPGINANIPGPFGDLQPYNGWDFQGTRWVSWSDHGGISFGGSLFNGADFIGSEGIGPADYVDVELRWAGADQATEPGRWSRGAEYRRDMGYAFGGIGDIPFTAWDIESDPPRQLNICFVEDANNGNTNLVWDMGWNPADSTFAASGGREYLFIMNSDYNEGADYDDNNWGPAADVLYAIWPNERGSGTSHPFLEGDWEMQIFASNVNAPGVTYSFKTDTAVVVPVSDDNALAKKNLDDINVFPNPYYATHSGERTIVDKWVEFTHLPPTCTIRIFTLAGALVRTMHRDGVTERTWEKWDLQNESELPVASGLYIYHISVPNVGEKIGKLAIFMPEERLDTF